MISLMRFVFFLLGERVTRNVQPRNVTFLPFSKELGESFLKRETTDQKMVLIHPSYGRGNRAWIPDRYVSLINMIHQKTAYRVVLTGTDQDRDINDYVYSQSDTKPINLTGKTSLKELVSVIACCDGVIGAETGPLHLAWALKKPVVSKKK